MEWNAQVLPILQKLGLNLTYQPGVFTGAELSTAIASITQNQIATLIKSLNHQFSSIVIGKRWDQDLAHGVILMDYHATASEIAAKLQQFDRPTTDIDFVAAKSALNIVLSNRGIKIDQIIVDLPTTAASLDLVKQFTTDVASTVDVSLLQKLGARTLRLNADTTGFVPYSNILYVRVPTSGSDLSQFLRSAIYKTAFEQMNLMLANDASNLGLTLSFNVTDAVTSVQNDRLSSFLQWFAATVTPAVKANTKLTALVVTDAGYGTTFAHGQLNVDLETFDPNQMPYILVAPAPTPGH